VRITEFNTSKSDGSKMLILMRGLPGSGKSTVSKQLVGP